jgi:aspartate/methionine/tyrosine aminotransferase
MAQRNKATKRAGVGRRPAVDPFERRRDYTRWCRRAYGAFAADPDARLLFDSTVCEPTERLFQVLRSHSAGAIADRYESVFSHGNRFVARAIAVRYGIDEQQILCTTGATNAVSMVLRTQLFAGGHAVIEHPNFDLLPYIAREHRGSVSYLPRRGTTFQPDPAELRTLLKPDTRVVLISNLHNPSGTALDADCLRALAAEAETFGAMLLVDEVYGDFARELYGGCAATLARNIISANSLSKVHGLFALRCGWVVASPQMIDLISEVNAQNEFGVSKLTHAVASFLLEDAQELDAHWQSVLATNRPILERHANELIAAGLLTGEVPEFGCMYFPELCGVTDTWKFASWLWRTHKLLVAPGELFGAPGRIRLGYGGGTEALTEGLGRFAAAVEQFSRKSTSRGMRA